MSHCSSQRRSIVFLCALLGAAAACGSSGAGDGTGGAATGGSSSGGKTGSGGSTGSGGQTATGGSPGTGGSASGSGGSGPTGTGGKVGEGSGGHASGGMTGSGGNQTGGHASGGMIGSGGTSGGGRGGAAATGSGGIMGGGGAGAAAGAGTGGVIGNGGAGGSSSTGSGMSAGCGKMPGIASSMYNNGKTISITAASMQRRFILNVPTNYDNTHAYKMVIAFHQLDGNDVQMYQNGYYHLLNLANNSTIFVAPEGQKNGAPCSATSNGDSGCGWPNPNNSDFALADAVVAQIEENFCVDTNRIFATGWSYGGAMSYETACARPLSGGGNGYIRAVAIYSGSPQITAGPCPPGKAVAYYASHGTQDNVLQYSGGVTMAQNFAMVNGCTWATPTMVNSGNHVCTTEMGCTSGYPVQFCSFNGPHTPDPQDGNMASWEYQNVWNFFNQF